MERWSEGPQVAWPRPAMAAAQEQGARSATNCRRRPGPRPNSQIRLSVLVTRRLLKLSPFPCSITSPVAARLWIEKMQVDGMTSIVPSVGCWMVMSAEIREERKHTRGAVPDSSVLRLAHPVTYQSSRSDSPLALALHRRKDGSTLMGQP